MERDGFRNHGAAGPYRLRSVLLCSDVHLTDDQPELTRYFCDWLEQQAQMEKPEAILILGISLMPGLAMTCSILASNLPLMQS